MPVHKIHRLTVLGCSGVGKTALIEQLIFGNHFIGVSDDKTLGDTYEALIETEAGMEEAVQIYDTPGALFSTELSREVTYDQDHYLSIGDGIVLVYDITSKSTFDLVKLLRQRIAVRHKEFPVVVIGNKYDLDGIRQVPLENALDWARSDGVLLYETSVLDRDSLKEPFSCISWSMANPGHNPPAHFHSSFGQHSSTRKSFTIPQTRSTRHHHHHSSNRHHQQDIPLISNTTPTKEDTPPPFKDQSSSFSQSLSLSVKSQSGREGGNNGSDAISTTKSISSSEYSFDSRISSRIYPEDATYPRSGLFGLADCMSTRSREKKST